MKGHSFILNQHSVISYPTGNIKMKRNAIFLSSYLKEVTGKDYRIKSGGKSGDIVLCTG